MVPVNKHDFHIFMENVFIFIQKRLKIMVARLT